MIEFFDILGNNFKIFNRILKQTIIV